MSSHSIRAFFFVFLGLMYIISLEGLLYASTLVAILLCWRSMAARIATRGTKTASEKWTMTFLCGQGLAAAAISVIPLQYAIPNAWIYVMIVANTISITNCITSLSAFLIRSPSSKA